MYFVFVFAFVGRSTRRGEAPGLGRSRPRAHFPLPSLCLVAYNTIDCFTNQTSDCKATKSINNTINILHDLITLVQGNINETITIIFNSKTAELAKNVEVTREILIS